jgi:hypothetical protein
MNQIDRKSASRKNTKPHNNLPSLSSHLSSIAKFSDLFKSIETPLLADVP